MLLHLQDWANLIVRWAHLIFGISWIGSSFYFMWLDKSLDKPLPPKDPSRVEGELWMVHSGGFYNVEKRLIRAGEMPEKLHWFKWEATFTWITGFLLLFIVYYLSGGANLLDPSISNLSNSEAILLCLGTFVIGWFVYDFLYQSPLANTPFANLIAFGLLAGVTYLFTHSLSGKAAFINIGGLVGTIMVANVWVRILPAQQQMINATSRGEIPDYTLGKKAKRRSTHNSYVTFPVLFIMLSNHFPATYSHPYSWIILLLMFVTGAGVRHFLILETKKSALALIPAITSLVIVILMTAPKSLSGSSNGAPVPFAQIKPILQQRCLSCHSSDPSDKTFGTMPAGVSFDDPTRAKLLSDRIKARVVDTKTMPLGNKTGMTQAERDIISAWIAQGSNIE